MCRTTTNEHATEVSPQTLATWWPGISKRAGFSDEFFLCNSHAQPCTDQVNKKSARGWLSRVRVDVRTVGLEPNLGSDLQGSRIMPAVHRTERAIVDAGIDRARAAMVEGIERLQPELQTCLFSEADVLHE